MGQVADVLAGNPAPQGEEFFADGKYPFVRVQDMGRLGGATRLNATNDYINDKAVKGLRLFPKGSVLFTKSGASTLLNQRAMLGSDMYVVSHIAVAIPKDEVLSEWLYYWLRTVDFAYLAHATTLPSLPLSKAKEIPLPIAPLDQQKRIVAEIEKQFSRLDEAVANLKRVKANLKRYKAAVLNEAVSSWPLQALGTLLREPLRNGHSAKATSSPKGLRAFTLSAVTEGDFSEVNTKRTVADPKRVAGLWAEPGDIYIERSNTPELVGTARLYRGPRNFAFIPDLLIRVRVSDAVVPEYAEIALQSESARHYFRSKAQGIAGTMPKIDQAVIEGFPLPLPDLAEQRRIVADVDRRLTIIHGVASAVDANSKRAQTLRQSTLQRCFAGKM